MCSMQKRCRECVMLFVRQHKQKGIGGFVETLLLNCFSSAGCLAQDKQKAWRVSVQCAVRSSLEQPVS